MTAHQYQRTTFDDVNDHAASLSQWDQRYDQVAGGRFEGQLEELWLGPLQVFRDRTSHAVLQRGVPCPHTLTLAMPVGDGPNEAWFCGRPVSARQAFGLVSHNEFELATRGAFDIVAIGVRRCHLEAQARGAGLGLPAAWEHNAVLDGSAAAGDGLRQLLLTALDTARSTPAMLAPGAAREALSETLCTALLGHLGNARPQAGTAESTAATRQRVVRDAQRHMRANADAPISVPGLCAALHVSRRTLQYSFQDVLQMSPMAYLRAMRLNGVRRDLRRGGDEAVADRAARWGFWHLSRFAADYRQKFGELPSETLRQACGRSAPH